MDRSASGGMAPALQSSNHQSSDFNQESGTTGLEDIVSHEKVNGNAFDIDSTLGTPVKHYELSPSRDAHGDATSSKPIFTEPDMIVTESCVLNGLKEALPAVSLPAVHLGQGDGVLTNNINHNGWGDCKKLHSGGILQENNISCNHHQGGEKIPNKINKTTCNETSLLFEGDKNKHTKEENENQPNGKIRTTHSNINNNLGRSQSPVLKSRMATVSLLVSHVPNTVTFSTATTTKTILTFSSSCVNPEKCNDALHANIEKCIDGLHAFNKTEASNSVSPEVHDDTQIIDNGGNGAQTSPPPQIGEQTALESMPHLSQALKYTDLLNSDLSQINVSHKLAHTLQELAASLKGTSLQLQTAPSREKPPVSILNHTVITSFQDPLHRSVKSLDFSNESRITEDEKAIATEEQKARIQVKLKTAIYNGKNLNEKLNSLKNKVDSLRARDLTGHIKKQLVKISSRAKFSWQSCNSQNWECGPVSVTELHPPLSTEATDSLPDFWSKLFDNNLLSAPGEHLSLSNGTFVRNQYLSKETSKLKDTIRRLPDSSVKKEFIIDDQKVSTNISGIDLDPIVQLTRVEHTGTDSRKKLKLLNQAKVNTGILQKELQFIRSRCDPDITDSSSDEDVTETSHRKKVKKYSKDGGKFTKTFRKSFCTWVAERAEISRRWMWLHSRISSLEFNVRQQGDLYTKLRSEKGEVQLEVSSIAHVDDSEKEDASFFDQTTPTSAILYNRRTPHRNQMPQDSTPPYPCNVNQLLNNVQQSTRLFDNLSPLSGGGSPSPNQPSTKNIPNADTKATDARLICTPCTEDLLNTSARTRQLSLSTFNIRKLIKLSPVSLVSSKPLKVKTVPNDSSIMCVGRENCINCSIDFKSLVLKAAQHDHSYHAVISSVKDIPLSISVRAVMKSKRKWCKKSGSCSRSASLKPERKESKKQNKYKKKSKHKSLKKRERSKSMLPPNHLDDASEGKRRKLSHVSDTSKKRVRGQSFDSDMEAPVSAYWKKKKSSEQAYDINNIVIPHGLNSARIEKLAYKEIQTPSWKIVELSKSKEEVEDEESSHHDPEDVSRASFQCRHDHYEIMEKRKYMAYMEWSISRKGRGSRMSNIRGPGKSEPISPSSMGYSASSLSFSGELFSTNTAPSAGYLQSPANPLSPTAKPAGVTTRRMSTDHNPIRPTTPLSNLQTPQGNTDTSLIHSYSSPILSGWQDGLGPQHNSQDYAALVNRTLSEGANSNKNQSDSAQAWESRSFPLIEDEIRMLNDVEYALQKMQGDMNRFGGETGHANNHSITMDGDTENYSKRQPFSRQNSGDKTLQSSMDHTMWSPSHVHKSMKRRRTDSRASSLASHDDGGRHSDASTNSASSSVRRRKKVRGSESRASQRRSEFSFGKSSQRSGVSSRTMKAKLSYYQTRLSETDDSLSDSDSDSHSSDDTSASYDDAGHVVDDFADPEWEYNPTGQRDCR